MSIRAILFDLDGTLVNSIGDITACGNEALKTLGCPVLSEEQYKAYLGDGVTNLARKVLPDGRRDAETVTRFVAAFGELYRVRWNVSASLYEGVPEMLSALERRGIRLAVLSNKKDEFTKLFVKELLPAWRFDAVRGESSEQPIKPDPTTALLIARELGIEASDCLFVGDSEVDCETARRAAMPFVGVEWGFRSRAQLEVAGATHIIQAPLDLLTIIDAIE